MTAVMTAVGRVTVELASGFRRSYRAGSRFRVVHLGEDGSVFVTALDAPSRSVAGVREFVPMRILTGRIVA